MIFYRCDCCGNEQEIKKSRKADVQTYDIRDPLGIELTYRPPVQVEQLGKDVCKDCYEALDNIRVATEEEFIQNLTDRLQKKWNQRAHAAGN